MILVDIRIPAVNERYDFMLDENVPAAQIITEIGGIMAKKVREQDAGVWQELVLCSIDRHRIINPGRTLYESGITDGSSLMLL